MAKPLPLVLSVKTENWRQTDMESGNHDAEFRIVKPKVRERDGHACRFCTFRYPKGGYYMQVHHFNNDHSDNSMENLVTTCLHCHAVQHIGFWGQDRGRGREASIIYLPEISQADLAHISRAILVAKRNCEKVAADPKEFEDKKRDARRMADAADALFDRFRAREAGAEKRLGSSDPIEVANALWQLDGAAPKEYEARAERLSPFRLLLLGPHCKERGVDAMPGIVDEWMATGGPFGSLKPATWKTLLQSSPLR